jgi:hypothetical protein
MGELQVMIHGKRTTKKFSPNKRRDPQPNMALQSLTSLIKYS